MSDNEKSKVLNDSVSSNPQEESTVSILEFLEHEKELEEECAAVYGASDWECCTYSKGHIKRQALYSCLTCCPEARNDKTKCAGICVACSYKCHENHELVELYTKRNFRCDCPTERIPGVKCDLNANCIIESNGKKLPNNLDNLYNHNFWGLYCICERPYPDPENPNQDEMIQCVVCEDWYHMEHLNALSTEDTQTREMICVNCMTKHEFLQDYVGLAIKRINGDEDNASSADISVCDDKLKSDLDKSISEIMNISSVEASAETENCENKPNKETEELKSVTEAVNEEGPQKKRLKLDLDEPKTSNPCRRPTIKSEWDKGATFWSDSWRSSLCKCPICIALYEKEKVTFLLDAEDPAKVYEERGIKRVAAEEATAIEQGVRAFAAIGHTQKIDAIMEYNRLKDKLKEFLQTFVANKKVVTEDDVNRFFQEMRNEKNSNLGQPYFCR